MKGRLIASCLAAAARLTLSSIAEAKASTTSQDNDKPAVDPAAAVPTPTENDAQALAKQLSNPIASLISLPLQSNWDWGAGPGGDGGPIPAEHPTGASDHPQQPMEPDLANHRTDCRAEERPPVRPQPVRLERRRSKPVPFAAEANAQWAHLGSWPSIPDAYGDGQARRVGEMGCGTNNGGPEAVGSLDLWCLGESYLVGSGQRTSLEC
jgi:hypothetical protein